MAGQEELFNKWMNAGHSAAWDGQWDKAAQAYQQALEEFPEHPRALANYGLALFELQRYEESLEVYLKATQVTPDDPLPLEKAAQLSERTSHPQEAIQYSLKAADLYIKRQEIEKALENWTHVTQLDPGNITTHTYLAMVHERLGHVPQAIHEYLATASLHQQAGNAGKAAEMVGRALHLSPGSSEARQAQNLLKSGQPLPKPLRSQGGTAMLRQPQPGLLNAPRSVDSSLDPVGEANKMALARLAEVLFDLSDEEGEMPAPRSGGMTAIVRGANPQDVKRTERGRMMLHISATIDAQSSGQTIQAAEQLEKAIEAGFKDPAAFYNLGFLRSGTERLEDALRNLQAAVKNDAYCLASRLLLGQVQRQVGRLREATMEYLEALKTADSLVVPPSQAVELRQGYEPLIEAQAQSEDPAQQEKLCNNIRDLLVQPGWRLRLTQAREQLPKPAPGMPPIPLAEIMAESRSGQVIEAIGRVRNLAKSGLLRTAMDEAYESLKYAPLYLPLHSLIGDLLVEEGRTQEAITKFSVVAQAYSVRGEASQAVALLRRIVQASPMDMAARNRLIEQLVARGSVDEAIGEYLDMADIYYRLAELDMARTTYTTALRLAQQGGANRAWSVKLLRRMADIDMQQLNWRQALRVFEQIRTIQPDDLVVRKELVQLNLRLGQSKEAAAELESFLAYLQSASRRGEAIAFLEDLVGDDPNQIVLRHALGEEFRHAERYAEAIAQFDALGSLLMKAGEREAAIQVIESIIAMNPPNVGEYAAVLKKLKPGD